MKKKKRKKKVELRQKRGKVSLFHNNKTDGGHATSSLHEEAELCFSHTTVLTHVEKRLCVHDTRFFSKRRRCAITVYLVMDPQLHNVQHFLQYFKNGAEWYRSHCFFLTQKKKTMYACKIAPKKQRRKVFNVWGDLRKKDKGNNIISCFVKHSKVGMHSA